MLSYCSVYIIVVFLQCRLFNFFSMKIKILSPKKAERPVLRPAIADTSFEEDWANGISGEEFVKRVHDHIRELYASQPKK